MTQISKKINIYKFTQLSELKQNKDYDKYIVVCIGEKGGLWYQFPEVIDL